MGSLLSVKRATKLEGGIDGTSTDGKWRMGIGDDSVVIALGLEFFRAGRTRWLIECVEC
jgi:hypothetical protein